MVYNSFNFLVIFPLIFLLYYLIPARYNRARTQFLLVVSYSLYMSWNPLLVLVLGGATFISYMVGKYIDKGKRKRGYLVVGIILSLLPLLLFKYFNFFGEILHDLLLTIGITYEQKGLNWTIPVGLSFYTLQAISYMSDVYQKKIKAESDFIIYALYLSFFPTILMGPINRASQLIPQLKNIRSYFDYPKAVEGLRFLLWGMFMKVVIADRSGIYVDAIYENYQIYSGSTCFIASIMYSIQIYCDFAGYSLMAMGVGKILGIEIMENFRRPYFSSSVSEFWKRWHISLSSWLRDYIYIPLGGSRAGKIKTYRNLLITFFISGLWHGANWTFILWGGAHAVWMIIERVLKVFKIGPDNMSQTIKIVFTFFFVDLAWIMFHSPSIYVAKTFYLKIFAFDNMTALYSPSAITVLLILIVLIKEIMDEYFPNKIRLLNSKKVVVRWTTYISLISLIMLEGVLDSGNFIYASF
mgnify:CR=1 FL=1